ncbi:MAG: type II secretion system protein GspG [Planctomycetota bacterium]
MYCKSRLNRPANRNAFTLTELLVVIAIIGLLSGVATVGMRAYLASSSIRAARIEMSEIVSAMDNFNSIKNRYPSSEEGVAILGQSTDEFPGGLMKGNLNDPWGNPYEYIVPGTAGEPFDIICSGPDGRIGTSDDIASFDLEDI